MQNQNQNIQNIQQRDLEIAQQIGNQARRVEQLHIENETQTNQNQQLRVDRHHHRLDSFAITTMGCCGGCCCCIVGCIALVLVMNAFDLYYGVRYHCDSNPHWINLSTWLIVTGIVSFTRFCLFSVIGVFAGIYYYEKKQEPYLKLYALTCFLHCLFITAWTIWIIIGGVQYWSHHYYTTCEPDLQYYLKIRLIIAFIEIVSSCGKPVWFPKTIDQR